MQKIDSQIYALTQEKNNILPLSLERIKSEFEQKKQKISIHEDKVKSLQLAKKDKEIDLSSKEESLRKSQGQLYQLKTNKEYQAKLNEIASLKADISIAEESVIGVLDDLEKVKGELGNEKEILNREEKIYEEEKQKIEKQIKDTEVQILSLQGKRRGGIENIDKQILSKYERLLKIGRAHV